MLRLEICLIILVLEITDLETMVSAISVVMEIIRDISAGKAALQELRLVKAIRTVKEVMDRTDILAMAVSRIVVLVAVRVETVSVQAISKIVRETADLIEMALLAENLVFQVSAMAVRVEDSDQVWVVLVLQLMRQQLLFQKFEVPVKKHIKAKNSRFTAAKTRKIFLMSQPCMKIKRKMKLQQA